MNSKVVVGFVGAVVILGVAAFLMLPAAGPRSGSQGQATPGSSTTREASGMDPVERQEQKDANGPSTGKRSPANQDPSRSDLDSGSPESGSAHLDAARLDDTASGQQGSSSRRRSDFERDSEDPRERDKRPGQGEDEGVDPLPGLPFGFSDEIAETDLDGAEAEGPTEEELDRKDLDLDEEIAPWEIQKTRRLEQRAKYYPRRNDDGDGAYPIERENSAMSEGDFDRVDGNGDGLMDQEEYYMHLVNSEKILILLDEDGDRQISFDESGLSAEVFEVHDHNFNGKLSDQETQKAVAAGAFD